MKYDVVFVGGGSSVVFGLSFLSKISDKKILIIEAGPDIDERTPSLHRLYGIGGAGAFSDFKLTLGELVGYADPSLSEYTQTAWTKFLQLADSCNIKYSSGKDDYPVPLASKLNSEGLRFLETRWAHFGSSNGVKLVREALRIIKQTFPNLEIWTSSCVERIDPRFIITLEDGRKVSGDIVVVAVGRSGHKLTRKLFKELDIQVKPGSSDIGVRVEFPQEISEPYKEVFYDPKIEYYSSLFGDKLRTFCANLFDGEVVEERYDGRYISVNGHSDPLVKKTNLSNFAILARYKFDEYIRDANDWSASIVDLANNLTGGQPLVQRIRDIVEGRKSTKERLSESPFVPSLATASPGDLSLVLPYRVMSGILEFTEKLDKTLFPGIIDKGVFYGIEAKFYGYKVIDNSMTNLFFVGDCSGQTRSILGSTAHMLKTLLSYKII